MMVTVNLWHLIAICAVAMILMAFIGYGTGLKVGYLRGWLDSMNHDALRGLGRAASQGQEGGHVEG